MQTGRTAVRHLIGIVFFVELSFLTFPAAAQQLEITFLANEGFHLTAGNSSLLIDSLFGDGITGYTSVPRPVRDDLEAARPPFDSVDLILTSHFHRDHFNARVVADFLSTSPATWFVSTHQAVAAVRATPSAPSDLAPRTRGFWPNEGKEKQLRVGDVSLRIFHLDHGPGTENLGLLIEVCGLTVLHIGDTESGASGLIRAGLEGIKPDVALLPSWYLRSDELAEAVRTVIQPKSIIAMHMPSVDAPPNYFFGGTRNLQGLTRAIHDHFPNALVPEATGDSTSISCR